MPRTVCVKNGGIKGKSSQMKRAGLPSSVRLSF
jgi:hypothetical protein